MDPGTSARWAENKLLSLGRPITAEFSDHNLEKPLSSIADWSQLTLVLLICSYLFICTHNICSNNFFSPPRKALCLAVCGPVSLANPAHQLLSLCLCRWDLTSFQDIYTCFIHCNVLQTKLTETMLVFAILYWTHPCVYEHMESAVHVLQVCATFPFQRDTSFNFLNSHPDPHYFKACVFFPPL